VLPSVRWTLCRDGSTFDEDERVEPIVTALAQGRRVVVQSAEPIDSLARQVWRVLPRRVRRRSSVATWAYDNANHFDLVALPKLGAAVLDTSDLLFVLERAPR
jgi:hypothetical protein